MIYQDRVFAAPSAPAQRCLVSLADEVSYDVAVLFSGARKNRTFPAACKEDDIALDAKGTGAAAYVCKFANASLVAPLTFNAEGIVPGDVGAAATVAPPAAAIAGKPSLKVAPAVQDLIKAGSNQTWVAYTVRIAVAFVSFVLCLRVLWCALFVLFAARFEWWAGWLE